MAKRWRAAATLLRRVRGDMSQPVTPTVSTPAQVEPLNLLFQPQICCDTGRIAALRLTTPGQVACCGAGQPLRDILGFGLDAIRGWDRLGLSIPFLSLPLPEQMLADHLIVEDIIWALDRHDLASDRIEIEIVEPQLRGAARQAVVQNLHRLSLAGCRIALGDFGMDGAGLDELRSFRAQRLRVGRRFLAECDRRADQQRMILAILGLAEHLGLEVLGDDITSFEERGFLTQIGFAALQGPAVAEAVSVGQMDTYLLDHGRELAGVHALAQRR